MKTTITKSSHSGWNVKTTKELEKTEKGVRVVEIATNKNGSNVSVSIIETQGIYEVVKHAIFEDYSKRIPITPVKRATEKNITASHNEALTYLDDAMAEIKQQYNLKD